MGAEDIVARHMQQYGSMNSMAIKKYLAEILKERYPKHQDIIERLASAIVTQRDLQEFGKLVAEIYEVGFLKAVEDYRHLLEPLGRDLKVGTEKPQSKPIFSERRPGRRST